MRLTLLGIERVALVVANAFAASLVAAAVAPMESKGPGLRI